MCVCVCLFFCRTIVPFVQYFMMNSIILQVWYVASNNEFLLKGIKYQNILHWNLFDANFAFVDLYSVLDPWDWFSNWISGECEECPYMIPILVKILFVVKENGLDIDIHWEKWIFIFLSSCPPCIQICFLLLCQSFWLCGSQKTVENSSRDGNYTPPDLPLERSVCRSNS